MATLLVNPSDEEVIKCINNRENFHIESSDQKETTKRIEVLLENRGYSVRIKTKGRED